MARASAIRYNSRTMEQEENGRITELLKSVRSGHKEHEEELFSLVYGQLRRLAQQHMKRESPGHTLQATALVNEAYIRIFGRENVDWQSRTHFMAIASREFRRALIEHARGAKAEKRGGDIPKVSLDAFHSEQAATRGTNVDFLVVNEILEQLQAMDADAAKVVELKFFAGLTDEEIAEQTGISFAKVRRHWTFARAWMLAKLQKQ